MTVTQTTSPVPHTIEPADLPLPRSMADAVLRGLLSGTIFALDGAPVAGAAAQAGESAGVDEPAEDEPAEDEPAVRVADRERMAPAHCRFGMQYLD
ncbi:hypothetical protein [Kitasatospora sp. NBC_01266]|uniref:hypothetical protein n=1 Tax=Kitasatospora sp. NBC_01266 TaxID=2903572 RepID=UPI002E32B8B0|nr:hypothetical protein [Kitasatospora sp. NBC_01266]